MRSESLDLLLVLLVYFLCLCEHSGLLDLAHSIVKASACCSWSGLLRPPTCKSLLGLDVAEYRSVSVSHCLRISSWLRWVFLSFFRLVVYVLSINKVHDLLLFVSKSLISLFLCWGLWLDDFLLFIPYFPLWLSKRIYFSWNSLVLLQLKVIFNFRKFVVWKWKLLFLLKYLIKIH